MENIQINLFFRKDFKKFIREIWQYLWNTLSSSFSIICTNLGKSEEKADLMYVLQTPGFSPTKIKCACVVLHSASAVLFLSVPHDLDIIHPKYDKLWFSYGHFPPKGENAHLKYHQGANTLRVHTFPLFFIPLHQTDMQGRAKYLCTFAVNQQCHDM